MNYEEQRRQRLITVLTSAVRIGRSGALPDAVVDAELRSLADLYLAADAASPRGVLTVPREGHYEVSADGLTRVEFRVLDETAAAASTDQVSNVSAECCPYSKTFYGADGQFDHIHQCDKVDGHASGPAASDHHCALCGAVFDEKGNSASPLGMGSLTVNNGAPEEQGEVEL